MIVVRPVAEASLLPISIVALGKARCMMSAQRAARPTSRVMPHPAQKLQTMERTMAAGSDRRCRIATIILGARGDIKKVVTGAGASSI